MIEVEFKYKNYEGIAYSDDYELYDDTGLYRSLEPTLGEVKFSMFDAESFDDIPLPFHTFTKQELKEIAEIAERALFDRLHEMRSDHAM